MGESISHVITVIDRQIKQVLSFGNLLTDDVEKDLGELSKSVTKILAVLKDAEYDQQISRQFKDCFMQAQDAAYDAEDILDLLLTDLHRWNTKNTNALHPWNIRQQVRSFVQNKAACKIKDVLARLDGLPKDEPYLLLEMKQMIQPLLPTTSLVDESRVFGREEDKEKILGMLLDPSNEEDDISVISIIGMAGMGKTTLAQLLYNDSRICHRFEIRMWFFVSHYFDLNKILIQILRCVCEMNYDPGFLTISELECRVLEVLTGKRFLIVLDDVWTESYWEWKPLKNILKEGGKGSRVLVTSRSTAVSDIVGARSPYILSCLSEDDSWSLFKMIALEGHNLSTGNELENIGKQIVQKCKNLPLAVKATAAVLRSNVQIHEWRRILADGILEVEDEWNIFSSLKASYNNLPSCLKECFAYCSIFPKGHVFHKKELIILWMAQGFIHFTGPERAEEIGSQYFDQLLMRSFFEPLDVDDKEKYHMHDLIHDLAQLIANPHSCLVKDSKQPNLSEKTRHAAIFCKDVKKATLEIMHKTKKLRTFLLSAGEHHKDLDEVLDKMFHTLTFIRVLDLSSSTILELPKSIENLKLLHYLNVSKTKIRRLPDSIRNLYNLQTLILSDCERLSRLPKDLVNLINLRHLELDQMLWKKPTTLPPRIGCLSSLHNLHVYWVRREDGYGIEELKGLAYLTGTLHISNLENAVNAGEAKLNEKESLEKLVLEWSTRDVGRQDEVAGGRVLEELQPHSNLKELQIFHYRGNKFPAWMEDGLLQNLVTVSLNHCTKCRILSFQQLPQLEHLYIEGMQELERWPEADLPCLHTLKISYCTQLTQLPFIFPKLEVLEIKRCDSLMALPVTPSLWSLTLVENLVLEDWNEVAVQRILKTDEGHPLDEVPSLHGLLELKITRCPKLRALPQILAPRKLEISGCELLETLPAPEYSQALEHLVLDACEDGKLVGAIPKTSSLYSLTIFNMSNVTYLPEWPCLPALRILDIRYCKDLVSLAEDKALFQGWTSLQELSIHGCPNLESLGPQDAFKSLTSLTKLHIEDCPRLKSLPEDGVPTSLGHLIIKGCPLLKERRREEDEGRPHWPYHDIPRIDMSPYHLDAGPGSYKPSQSSAPRYHLFSCCKGT